MNQSNYNQSLRMNTRKISHPQTEQHLTEETPMKTPEELRLHTSYVMDVLFTPDNQFLVSAGMDNIINIFNMSTWKLHLSMKKHTHSVNKLVLTSDAKLLVSGSTDKTVKIWSFPDGKEQMTLEGHKKTVTTVNISNNQKYLVSGSYEGIIQVWNFPTGEKANTIKAFERNVANAVFLHDNTSLVVSGLNDNILIFDSSSGDLIQELTGHKTAVNGLSLSANGDYLASIGYEGTTKIWSTTDWEVVYTLTQGAGGNMKSVFSPDSKALATIADHKVMLWSLESGEKTDETQLKPKGVTSVIFSPDGKWLAVGAADKKIRLWNRTE